MPLTDWEKYTYRTMKDLEKASMQSLIIELRYDNNDNPEIDAVAVPAAKSVAKHLYTIMSLVAGKRKPQISLRMSDMFVTEEEISLAEDITPEVNE
jgi:hypothetical protein